MTPELHDRVINQLVETGVSDEPWALLIVAALEGEAQLTGYLEAATNVDKPVPRATGSEAQHVEPPGAYVSSITVEGFRGIGPSTTLTLKTWAVARTKCGRCSAALRTCTRTSCRRRGKSS